MLDLYPTSAGIVRDASSHTTTNHLDTGLRREEVSFTLCHCLEQNQNQDDKQSTNTGFTILFLCHTTGAQKTNLTLLVSSVGKLK